MTRRAYYVISWFVEGAIPRSHFKNSANELVDSLCNNPVCRNIERIGLRIASRRGLREITRRSPLTLIHQRDETLAVKIDVDTQRRGRPSSVRSVGAVRVSKDDTVHVKQSLTETQLPDTEIIKRANAIRGSVTSRSIGVWLARHAVNCCAAIPLRTTGGVYLMPQFHIRRFETTMMTMRSRMPETVRRNVGMISLRLRDADDVRRIAEAHCDALLVQLRGALKIADARVVWASGQQPEFQRERALVTRLKLVYASYDIPCSKKRAREINTAIRELNRIIEKHDRHET